METPRHALRDIGVNSPSVKRQKREATELDQRQPPQPAQQKSNSLPLGEWQKKWKAIMKVTVVYFDLSNGQDLSSKERELASRLFIGAGATLVPFFDSNVTIVITKRPKSALPKNMANNDLIKVWDYVKVFRFFNNLGEKIPHDKGEALVTMWQDEKLHGVADRDPSAKRDDIHYFKHPFIHVYDLRDITKPVAAREWKPKERWPQIYASTCGHTLFQEDPSDTFDERRVRRRKIRDRQGASFRLKLRQIYDDIPRDSDAFSTSPGHHGSENSTMHSRNDVTTHTAEANHHNQHNVHVSNVIEQQSRFDQGENVHEMTEKPKDDGETTAGMPPPLPAFTRPPVLSRQTSGLHNKFLEATKRDHGEIQASGYNGSVSQQSAEYQSRNGLAPTVSTTSSKQLNTLQRKTMKRQIAPPQPVPIGDKEKVSGYCENCKVHFDDFDEHIVSNQHRDFATDSSNFEDIDDLIGKLKSYIRSKR